MSGINIIKYNQLPDGSLDTITSSDLIAVWLGGKLKKMSLIAFMDGITTKLDAPTENMTTIDATGGGAIALNYNDGPWFHIDCNNTAFDVTISNCPQLATQAGSMTIEFDVAAGTPPVVTFSEISWVGGVADPDLSSMIVAGWLSIWKTGLGYAYELKVV